jgi:hypothetical protein
MSAHVQADRLDPYTFWGLCGLLLQRILKVDYHIPSHIKLSPEGHDLLKKVLVADPGSRINVQQVRMGLSCWTGIASGTCIPWLLVIAFCVAAVECSLRDGRYVHVLQQRFRGLVCDDAGGCFVHQFLPVDCQHHACQGPTASICCCC